jgi:cell division protein FtsB
MVMTVVRMEITAGTPQQVAELGQIIVESVRSTVPSSLSNRRRKKSRLPTKKRDVSSEIQKLVSGASFDALINKRLKQSKSRQDVKQVSKDSVNRTQQRQKRLNRLSPERRGLYEQIKKLRDEVGSVDFNVIDNLREMREST